MHRSLGGPLPRQLANAPHAHPSPPRFSPSNHAAWWLYGVLVIVSNGYPPVTGRLHTCYSPVRRSPADKASFIPDAPRLACVRPVASVHPEPGSNSPLLLCYFNFCSYYLGSLRLSKSFRFYFTWNKFFFIWRDASAVPSVLFPLCFLLSYRNNFNVLNLSRFPFKEPPFFPKASAKLIPFSELPKLLY